jgi:hypothetical protein
MLEILKNLEEGRITFAELPASDHNFESLDITLDEIQRATEWFAPYVDQL